jgi:hypothetical protein
MVREGGIGDIQLGLHLAHNQSFGMRGEQELHDAKASLGAHGGKHVGVAGHARASFAQGRLHISTLLEIPIHGK